MRFAPQPTRTAFGWFCPALFGVLLTTGCPGSNSSDTTGLEATTANTTGATELPADGSSGDAPFAYAPCETGTRAGRFIVQLEDEYTQVEGQIFDKASPVPPAELDAADGCRLLETQNPFCDPPCTPSDVCVVGGSCEARPTSVSVGTVTIEGLSAEVAMMPNVSNFYLNLEPLPHPGFEPGAMLTLSADGSEDGAHPSFTLAGFGSQTFDVLQEQIPLAMGQPVSVTWVPSASPDLTRVHIDLDIGHHGGSPATIECDVEDTGAFEIPASLVDQLIAFGVAGFPAIRLTRQTVDSVMLDAGCVEFVVAPSSADLEVLIDGIVSCNTDADCPDGQTCQVDLVCG